MQFYSNDADSVSKQIIVSNKLRLGAAKFSESDLKKCIDWICSGKYIKVCLQFPDEFLAEVVDIVQYIENGIDNKVYVLADTSYGSCCIHDITAKHIDADAIIHFGRACLSRSYDLPVLYIYPRGFIDVADVASQLKNLLNVNNGFFVLLYDVVFSYCIDEINNLLSDENGKLIYSRLVSEKQNSCGMNCRMLDGKIKHHTVTKFGRCYCCPADAVVTYVYLTSADYRKNLDNFLGYLTENVFYSYDSDLCTLTKQSPPANIKKRLYQIEKVKDAKIVGILIATSPNNEMLTLIKRIKMLCRRKGKRCYTMYVGNPNVAKLANFPEVDVFVFISCLEGKLTDEGVYYQPVVTMMELELALNEAQVWKNKVVIDFREYLPGGDEYIDLPESPNPTLDATPDVSLISNHLRSSTTTNAFADEDLSSRFTTALSVKDPMTVMSTTDSIKGGLQARTWKGLEMNVGNVPVAKAVIGLSGTPSSGYTCPRSDVVK